jgi:hypothetical protein
MVLAELDDLLLGWSYNIDFLDGMSHTLTNTLQTQWKDM